MNEHIPRPRLEVRDTKPLGHKSYGSIGHLPGSRLGIGDHHLDVKQAALLTHARNPQHKGARVVIQQKIDGACTAVAKINGAIVPLGRAGYPAATAPHAHIRDFHAWAMDREARFAEMLHEGERVVGEWMGAKHSIAYLVRRQDAMWVAFDIMRAHVRSLSEEVAESVARVGLASAHTIHHGLPLPVEEAYARLAIMASDFDVVAFQAQPEGLVYRYEHADQVKFLGKWVRADFVGAVPADETAP